MRKETRHVYFCGHCKKNGLSAASISRHEKYCRYNPENKHKCFDYCKHLKRERIAQGYYATTEFTCKLTGQKMYSYQLEKKKTSFFANPLKLDGIRMPLVCDKYQSMSSDEIESRYSRDE